MKAMGCAHQTMAFVFSHQLFKAQAAENDVNDEVRPFYKIPYQHSARFNY